MDLINRGRHEALCRIPLINLKTGTREQFHRLYIQELLPLLKRWNIDVVAHGPSLHDENTYYVIRRFDSLAQREQTEDAFYGSDDWMKGPARGDGCLDRELYGYCP